MFVSVSEVGNHHLMFVSENAKTVYSFNIMLDCLYVKVKSDFQSLYMKF